MWLMIAATLYSVVVLCDIVWLYQMKTTCTHDQIHKSLDFDIAQDFW